MGNTENATHKGRNDLILLICGGFAAGIANGLLGAGGGIIMTFVLAKVFKGATEGEVKRDLFANVIAATLPVAVLSTVIYSLRGDMKTDGFSVFVLPSVIGGITGALFLSRINTTWLKRIFALLVIWSGIYMILK